MWWRARPSAAQWSMKLSAGPELGGIVGLVEPRHLLLNHRTQLTIGRTPLVLTFFHLPVGLSTDDRIECLQCAAGFQRRPARQHCENKTSSVLNQTASNRPGLIGRTVDVNAANALRAMWWRAKPGPRRARG